MGLMSFSPSRNAVCRNAAWFLPVVLGLVAGTVSLAAEDFVFDCADPTSENLDGCQFGDVVALPGVDFDTGSAQLNSRAARVLKKLAGILKANTEVVLEIAGHTDNVGSAETNRRLSKRRANTVKTYLVLNGIPEDRLTAEGYGEASPVADNTTPEGRKQNRRVELRIVAIN